MPARLSLLPLLLALALPALPRAAVAQDVFDLGEDSYAAGATVDFEAEGEGGVIEEIDPGERIGHAEQALQVERLAAGRAVHAGRETVRVELGVAVLAPHVIEVGQGPLPAPSLPERAPVPARMA